MIFKLTLGMVRAAAWIYGVILIYTGCGALLLAATGRRSLAARDMYIGQWTTLFLFSMLVVLLR